MGHASLKQSPPWEGLVVPAIVPQIELLDHRKPSSLESMNRKAIRTVLVVENLDSLVKEGQSHGKQVTRGGTETEEGAFELVLFEDVHDFKQEFR